MTAEQLIVAEQLNILMALMCSGPDPSSVCRCGDLVLTLRDGSKLEIRSLPDFERNYNYIRERTSAR